MLTFRNISLALGGRTILDGASAALPARARVGLVGRNGAGKSTLLKIVAGLTEADGGSVDTPRGTRIGYLAQEAPGGETSPHAFVLAADTERARLMAEAEHAGDAHRMADIQERLMAIDAHSAPARAARILSGLGFDEAAQAQPLSAFSGGWRMRVSLAALLFSNPDVLLLDEPSNHLDVEAAIWLENFLRKYPATLLLVSHERDLLNNVVDHVLHLDHGKITLYAGNYDGFERQRAERQAQADAERRRQESQRQKLQSYIDRWGAKAHTARQAQSRMKALKRMAPIAAATIDPSLSFQFPNPEALRPPLITLDHAAVGYAPGHPILTGLNLRIDPDDRIAILGRNGNGKTTLARLLSGQLKAMEGGVTRSGKLKVGYFTQHQVEELSAADTPFQHMARLMPEAKASTVRGQLGRFGFSGDKADVAVSKLSGGERARLALALITRDAPHVIILDEPTNHLDVDTREALVQALNDYDGAVLIVSHDKHLLELTADRLVLVADGKAREFDGSLDDYRDMILKGEDEGEKPKKAGPSPGINKKDQRRQAAERRKETQDLRNAAKKAEQEVTRLTGEKADIGRRLADPDVYQGDEAPALIARHAELSRQLEAAEDRWLTAQERLEAAEADVA